MFSYRNLTFSYRRTISTTPILDQSKHRLAKTRPNRSITRPALLANNPYLPSTAVLNNNHTTGEVDPNSSWTDLQNPLAKFPILVPLAALDPKLSRKLRDSPLKNAENQISDPVVAREVRRDGEIQLNQIVEDWIRNELNVMGTIREETVQIFLKLLLHPSTLAPLAEKLKLQTAGRAEPVKASGRTPRRTVTAMTTADEELLQLLHYMIGATYRTLKSIEDGTTTEKFRRYVLKLIQVGLTKEKIKYLLVRSSQLSGQEMIGIKKGFARAELRVAQLDLWGQRRTKKINKLVPEQIIHRTRFRDRKALILKQRWVKEELKMIHWRRRLMNISAFQENEIEADRLRRLDHSNRIKQWRQIRASSAEKQQASSSTHGNLLSKIFNLWPFNNFIVNTSSPTKSSTV